MGRFVVCSLGLAHVASVVLCHAAMAQWTYEYVPLDTFWWGNERSVEGPATLSFTDLSQWHQEYRQDAYWNGTYQYSFGIQVLPAMRTPSNGDYVKLLGFLNGANSDITIVAQNNTPEGLEQIRLGYSNSRGERYQIDLDGYTWSVGSFTALGYGGSSSTNPTNALLKNGILNAENFAPGGRGSTITIGAGAVVNTGFAGGGNDPDDTDALYIRNGGMLNAVNLVPGGGNPQGFTVGVDSGGVLNTESSLIALDSIPLYPDAYGVIASIDGLWLNNGTVTVGPYGNVVVSTTGNLQTRSLEVAGGTIGHSGGTLSIDGGVFDNGGGDLDITSSTGSPLMRFVNGATAHQTDVNLGLTFGENGSLQVSGQGAGGAPSAVIADGYFRVGDEGTGTLTVDEGGRVEAGAANRIYVGFDVRGVGHLTADHLGEVNAGDILVLGYSGNGHADVKNGAAVTVNALTTGAVHLAAAAPQDTLD
ncbi:MAG: hypothetical protein KDA61_22580, partial [Planctomycetales bacterium]|nr:hypothetical protein [Planctomycetales bacterium]